MNPRFKRSLIAAAILPLAVGGMILGSAGKAFAYGTADQPIAQVEISGNCDNPSFPLCAPPPDGVGLGGVWVWSELDTSGGVVTSGTMDATVTFCGHVIGGGGPGSAGAGGGPVRGGTWSTISSLADAPPGAFPFYDPSKYTGSLRVLDFFPGTGSDDFIAVVPAQVGHYSLQPVHGVTIQTQVAP
jgi:hypothetical protein